MPAEQQTLTGLLCIYCCTLINEPEDFDDSPAPPDRPAVNLYFHGRCYSSMLENYRWYCNSCEDMYINPSSINAIAVFDRFRNTTRRRTREESERFVAAIEQLGFLFGSYTRTREGYQVCDECGTNCESCGDTFYYEENAGDCCNNGRHFVQSYSYRPHLYKFWYEINGEAAYVTEPEYHMQNGALFMGIELEMERAENTLDDFYEVSKEKEPPDMNFVYFKSDGSLSSSGVEMVTMPATLDAFKIMFPFNGLKAMHQGGARSYAYDSCGLHIHISRKSFETPMHLWKFVRFQMKNVDKCINIAQRNSEMWASWQNNDAMNKLPKVIKGTDSNDRRYVALNFQNLHTIELRYFKGNLLEHAIMRNLEFVQAMFDYTKKLTTRNVMQQKLSWVYFEIYVSHNKDKYPNLFNYIAKNATYTGESEGE